ncbi:hypothetical protein ACEN2L_11910 [Flavobacterium sp. W21_SRS_FM6]
MFIVKGVRQESADDVLQPKDNRKSLHEEIKTYFHKLRRERSFLFDAEVVTKVDEDDLWNAIIAC